MAGSRKPSWPRLYRRAGAPVAWWLLDAPRGTYPGDAGQVADLTGNNAAATLPAGWAFGAGPLGSCLTNVSGTAPVLVADAPQNRLAYLTVTVRALLSTAASGTYTIACKYQNADSSSTGLAWILRVDTTGHLTVYLNAGTYASYDTGFVPAAGVWHHYAVTYDGSSLHFYVDGALVYTSAAGPGPLLTTIASPVGIGDSTGAYAFDEFWVGSLDDIRLYDRALSAGEVAREYADPFRRLRPRGYDPATLAALSGGGAAAGFRAFWTRTTPLIGSGIL